MNRGFFHIQNATTNLSLGRSAATLIELLVLFAMIGFAVAGALIAGQKYDWKYSWLPGALVGAVLPLITLGLAAFLHDMVYGGGLPTCRDGSCRGPGNLRGFGDYEVKGAGESRLLVCKHGVTYRRKGKRFVIVNVDATETPYLIWLPFRGWFPDKPKPH